MQARSWGNPSPPARPTGPTPQPSPANAPKPEKTSGKKPDKKWQIPEGQRGGWDWGD